MEEQENIEESKLLLHMNEDPDDGDAMSSNNVNSKFVYLTTLISAFSLFTLGYDTGVISGSMVLITEQFSLSYFWQELLVSLAIGPAVLGTFFGGYFNGVIGRKATLLVSSIVFSIGALVMGCAPSKEILLVGRIVTGVAIGFTCVSTSLYIAETAPARIRGKLISVGALFITGSQFFAAVIGGIFSGNKENGWRYMLGLGAVPSLVFCAAVLMIPESPRWFISKGRLEEATKTLQRLRGGIENVEEEINEIKRRHKMSNQEGSTWTVLFKMLQESNTRKALLVACLVMSIQQLSGINTVMYYTATIIKMAGVTDDKKAIWLAAAVAFANFLFTFLAFFLVERVGRRKLILSSLGCVIPCLILLAVAFHLKVEYSPAVTMPSFVHQPNDSCSLLETCDQCLHNKLCGFCYLDDGESLWNTSCVYITNMTGVCDTEHNFQLINQSCPSSVAWLAVLAMVSYLVCFAPGLGPVPFVICSEIFPLWARTTGFACAVATYFLTNLVISMTFLHVSELLTTAGWFILSAGFSLLGWVFIYFAVPETKGRPLEHMQELFRVNEPE